MYFQENSLMQVLAAFLSVVAGQSVSALFQFLFYYLEGKKGIRCTQISISFMVLKMCAAEIWKQAIFSNEVQILFIFPRNDRNHNKK